MYSIFLITLEGSNIYFGTWAKEPTLFLLHIPLRAGDWWDISVV